MQDIFNPRTIEGLKARVRNISTDSTAQWGKMTTWQMLKHCCENEKLLLREKAYDRLFIGRLFGKMSLKSMVKDDKPLKQNQPTHPEFKIKGDGDLERQKKEWMTLLDKYPYQKASDYASFVHPFFGKMTYDEVNIAAYKHIDHHLRQFGV